MNTLDALGTAAAIRAGRLSALEAAQAALKAIDTLDGRVNAFTAVTRERALTEAKAIDTARAAGHDLPPLAGVPYAAKNLFDIAGLTTVAGSKINRENPPAKDDSALVARMRGAGAVLVGALNMDEYAFGFTTENAHYGTARNPHDLTRIAGGSSGGSGAAVAAGMVPLSLGTDTNGSIRVPSSLCGIFGIKPTYGRLSRRGSYPFTCSLDHVGPFARSVADLAATYDALQGQDTGDYAQARRAMEPTRQLLKDGLGSLRVAVAGGYFKENAGPQALAAVEAVARALNVSREVILPEAQRARAAGFVITASEGSNLHLPDLRKRPDDFDPAIRDRFLANALTPVQWYMQAQRFRLWFFQAVMRVFADTDVIIAPATPVPATVIGADTFELNGRQMPARPSMGVLTQPLSFIGLPIVAVPVHGLGPLPIGVQVIARPWREADALRVAAALEYAGVASAPVAPL
ncbi:MAG TPA: AtzE family amidohydrolase [Burkholderiales bacterium]|jgi:AtzE family amidohydrolase|nr:AtzE family amidohydrolase [Burkholderiales bacterium]